MINDVERPVFIRVTVRTCNSSLTLKDVRRVSYTTNNVTIHFMNKGQIAVQRVPIMAVHEINTEIRYYEP